MTSICSSSHRFTKLDILLSSPYLGTLAAILTYHCAFEGHSYVLLVAYVKQEHCVYCNIAHIINSIAPTRSYYMSSDIRDPATFFCRLPQSLKAAMLGLSSRWQRSLLIGNFGARTTPVQGFSLLLEHLTAGCAYRRQRHHARRVCNKSIYVRPRSTSISLARILTPIISC
jgi:hypothetical protein